MGTKHQKFENNGVHEKDADQASINWLFRVGGDFNSAIELDGSRLLVHSALSQKLLLILIAGQLLSIDTDMGVCGQESIKGVVKVGFGGRCENGREMTLGPVGERRKYEGHGYTEVGIEDVVGLKGVIGSEGISRYAFILKLGCGAPIAAPLLQ